MNAHKIGLTASRIAGAAIALMLAAPAAHASLVGDTVSCSLVPAFWTCDNPTAVVGAGPEFRLLLTGAERFTVDIGANSVRMDFTSPFGLIAGAGEVLTLSDLDWVGMIGEIIGITNFQTAGTVGMVASDVTFAAHSVSIDFNNGANFAQGAGTFVSFDLVTQHVVPEPGTAALVALGALAALAGRRRRLG